MCPPRLFRALRSSHPPRSLQSPLLPPRGRLSFVRQGLWRRLASRRSWDRSAVVALAFAAVAFRCVPRLLLRFAPLVAPLRAGLACVAVASVRQWLWRRRVSRQTLVTLAVLAGPLRLVRRLRSRLLLRPFSSCSFAALVAGLSVWFRLAALLAPPDPKTHLHPNQPRPRFALQSLMLVLLRPLGKRFVLSERRASPNEALHRQDLFRAGVLLPNARLPKSRRGILF